MSTRAASSLGETVKVGGAILSIWAITGYGIVTLVRATPADLLILGAPSNPGITLTLLYYAIILHVTLFFIGTSAALLLFICSTLAEYYSNVRRRDTA